MAATAAAVAVGAAWPVEPARLIGQVDDVALGLNQTARGLVCSVKLS